MSNGMESYMVRVQRRSKSDEEVNDISGVVVEIASGRWQEFKSGSELVGVLVKRSFDSYISEKEKER